MSRYGRYDKDDAVARLGGLVEGRPTHEGNFLQRIDALVRIEEEATQLRNSLAVRNRECKAARSAILRTTTDSLRDYVNYKESRKATDADGGCE